MILTKPEYLQSINYLLPDNATQQISPEDLRTSLVNLVDSVHNFLEEHIVNCVNLGSPATRTTRVGDQALSKFSLPGRSNLDNSAVGYYALGGNYNGRSNTAVGSHSLGCNLYGSENVAIGLNALAGNVTGSGNVGIGNYTLQSNKHGDFNIAIGNAAGYYVGENSNYKLYVASHPLTLEFLCDIDPASGTAPLIYGDLLSLKLGIGTKTLHDYGALQVNGSVSPVQSKGGSLGNERYLWNKAYISSGIAYDDNSDLTISVFNSSYNHQDVMTFDTNGNIGVGTSSPSGSQGLITVQGNIVPAADSIYVLGHPDLKWDAIFNDIIVSGNAKITDLEYTTITSCLYECKTLHLATSGICEGDIFNSSVCGYLSDEGLDGAGFEVHSSGSNYRRDYRFIYKAPDQTLTCLEVDDNYSRSRWQSNISLELVDGTHLQTQRVLSKDHLSLVSSNGEYFPCFGINIDPDKIYFGYPDSIVDPNDRTINFLFPSGLSTAYSTRSSGVKVSQDFISRNTAFLTGNQVRGFSLVYSDEKDQIINNQFGDRFSIRTISGSGSNFNNNEREIFTALRSGNVGISNIQASSVIPQTLFNVQSSGECAVRFSSSGINNTRLQLLGNTNVLASGFELKYITLNKILNYSGGYSNDDPLLDFSLIFPSGNTFIDDTFLSVSENGYIAIGQPQISGQRIFKPNAPLTISHNTPSSGTLSLRAQSSAPPNTSGFIKIYGKPLTVGSSQFHSMFFIDGSGNEFNVIRNPNNTTENLLYGDNQGNTYGGYFCPVFRPTDNCVGNTALGYAALSGVTTGSENVAIGQFAGQSVTSNGYNVFIGANAGKSFNSGYGNTIVGANAYSSNSVNGSNNVIIGWSNLYQTSSSASNVIAIGTELSQSAAVANYSLLIGFGTNPLITGSLGNSNRSFNIKNGTLGVLGPNDEQQLLITTIDEGSKYVTAIQIKDDQTSSINEGYLSLRFLDQNNYSRTLMDFDFSSNPMTSSGNFEVATPERPYASISGDLRLLGAIRFANGTSIEDGNVDVELNFIDLPNALDTPNTITTTNSYLAMSVPSGDSDYVGRITLQAISDYVGSGFAAVSNNCNHIWSNAENSINKTNNSESVFIGCNVAVGATGWKNAVMIGTEAGVGATTPNNSLATDTACIFIGYRAGRNADNTDNCVFVGENAGYNSLNASNSIFIGQNAGLDASFTNSIGFGENALRGSGGVIETGARNIEIVTGLLDNQRLMYSGWSLSDRLNIQNTIAGHTERRRISIGHATLNPDAVLSVRKNDIILGHASSEYIQTWWCNNTIVAAIDCDGNFIGSSGINGSGISLDTIEGIMMEPISAPLNPYTPTSGLIQIKNDLWDDVNQVYIFNRDPSLSIPDCAYVIATKINGTYRPTWVSCSGNCTWDS